MDKRLKEIFPKNHNKPFGGINIILAGDFGQLRCMSDFPFYEDSKIDQPA